VVLAAARADPVGFVDDLPDRSTLDEVQRAPELFTAIKAAVDRARKPGRFLLTGSANVLLVPRLADSLAGRMEILRLHPLAQCELAGRRPRFLDKLFEGRFPLRRSERLGPRLAELELPSLLVSHPHDPMVPPWTYERHLSQALPALEQRLLSSGGHVGYPPGIDLGEQGPRGVEAQALSWLLRH